MLFLQIVRLGRQKNNNVVAELQHLRAHFCSRGPRSEYLEMFPQLPKFSVYLAARNAFPLLKFQVQASHP